MFGGIGTQVYWLLSTSENKNYFCRYYWYTQYTSNYIHKNVALKVGAEVLDLGDSKRSEL